MEFFICDSIHSVGGIAGIEAIDAKFVCWRKLKWDALFN